MASSVKSRRNHYAVLGLEPGATDAEIAAAFAVESRKIIQNPRVNEPDVREKARQVRTAHQTLRDPVKRSAYDASIGLGASAPGDAADAPGKPSGRPFVAATTDQPKDDLVTPRDEPARAERRRPEQRPNAATGLREGLFVAAMAAKAKAGPQEPSEPVPPVDKSKTAAGEAAAASPPQPEPSAEPPHRFEDPGADTAALYGERRGPKLNRAAAGGVAGLAAALAIGAFWLWPSQDSGGPTTVAERPIAGADDVPPDVLNGAAPEQTATDDPFGTTEMADAGSYQSVTFADSGPIPESSAAPGLAATLPPAPSGPGAAPPAVSDQGPATPAATAAASPVPNATSAAPAASAAIAAAPLRSQPAPDLRPVTPPKLVRGSILNSDNRRGAYQGTVSVLFTVGANGRATECSPTATSGDPRLDAYTCELVQQRLQFTPAMSAKGQPVAAEMRATYNWGRKRRTLTGRLLDIVR